MFGIEHLLYEWERFCRLGRHILKSISLELLILHPVHFQLIWMERLFERIRIGVNRPLVGVPKIRSIARLILWYACLRALVIP